LDQIWRSVLKTFEASRPSLAALLAHAEVISSNSNAMSLSFSSKIDADRAEKARGEIDSVVSSALGRPVKIGFTVGSNGPATVRSEVGVENDAAVADRKTRELEARQHPVIRSAQDVFGASLKEIKT
jgi:hypothetical protein